MSAKKPWFKARNGLAEIVRADGYNGWYAQQSKDWGNSSTANLYRVRVTDARELTAEKAVERVLQRVYMAHDSSNFLELLAEKAGMTATVKNGKVLVRRGKR